jgi:hypothetical protein
MMTLVTIQSVLGVDCDRQHRACVSLRTLSLDYQNAYMS